MSGVSGQTCAAIDVGTNTVLLLVARIEAGPSLHELHQELRTPRLGQGLAAAGRIQPANAQNALTAVQALVNVARSYAVDWIKIVGTAALREAENGGEFCRQVHEMTGLTIEIISGDNEARYAYLGALSNKPHLQGHNVVIDIGGGSTELIWGKDRRFEFGVSLDIGSVKLTEAHGLDARCDTARCDQATRHFRAVLAAAVDDLPRPGDHLIGTAGTWTTLAAVQAEMSRYDAGLIDGSQLRDHEISHLVERFSSLTASERLQIAGMSPGREDVILGGTLIASAIMRWSGKHRITISDRGVRAGVLLAGAES